MKPSYFWRGDRSVNFYMYLLFSICLLIILTPFAFMIDFVGKTLEKRVNPKYLKLTIIMILLFIMAGSSFLMSVLSGMKMIDTFFITSLCFFGLGWITNITNKAHRNMDSTFAKFVTNNAYKYQYEASGTPEVSLYFISSLIFLGGSWVLAFVVALL